MANINLTLYTNCFIGSVLMSPIQMGSLRVNNSVTNISCLGTFKPLKMFMLLSRWYLLGHDKGHLPAREYIISDRLIPILTLHFQREINVKKLVLIVCLVKADFGINTLLKVPKHENFLIAFFALSKPIWVCDLGTAKKIQFFYRLTPDFDGFGFFAAY